MTQNPAQRKATAPELHNQCYPSAKSGLHNLPDPTSQICLCKTLRQIPTLSLTPAWVPHMIHSPICLLRSWVRLRSSKLVIKCVPYVSPTTDCKPHRVSMQVYRHVLLHDKTPDLGVHKPPCLETPTHPPVWIRSFIATQLNVRTDCSHFELQIFP